MPPRYFKSEIFSRLLPGYFLRRHSSENVGLTSYGGELAWSLSEESRNFYLSDGGQLLKDTAAKKRWRTAARGEMWAAGVGGPLLGFGFHLGIVDDPTDPQKAHSPKFQRRFREWWPSKFLSRQEPGARIVVVMQRLGVEDPIDFLLRREVGDGEDLAPEGWHVVLADEIRSDEPLGRWDGPMGLPSTCTLELDERKVGDALAPSRFTLTEVNAMQTAAGPLVAAAQRQGRPMMPKGDFWRLEWFVNVYKELPPDAHDGGKDWDTAYTKDDANAASAFVESYRGTGPDGKFPIFIHDIDWEWLEFPKLVDWMAGATGPHFIEAKATGKSAAQALRSEGIAVSEVSVKGDKFARAAAVQRVVASKRVWVRESILRRLLYGERLGLLRVTSEGLQGDDAGLDLNDAFVQALARHAGVFEGKRARFIG